MTKDEILVYDLTKKYVFETFDFKNNTPENLLATFQDISNRLSEVLDEQSKPFRNESVNQSLNLMDE